jgi:hypothetical protein
MRQLVALDVDLLIRPGPASLGACHGRALLITMNIAKNAIQVGKFVSESVLKHLYIVGKLLLLHLFSPFFMGRDEFDTIHGSIAGSILSFALHIIKYHI